MSRGMVEGAIDISGSTYQNDIDSSGSRGKSDQCQALWFSWGSAENSRWRRSLDQWPFPLRGGDDWAMKNLVRGLLSPSLVSSRMITRTRDLYASIFDSNFWSLGHSTTERWTLSVIWTLLNFCTRLSGAWTFSHDDRHIQPTHRSHHAEVFKNMGWRDILHASQVSFGGASLIGLLLNLNYVHTI